MKTVEDIEDASKWIINDLPQLKQIMKEVDGELQKWKDANATIVSELREVESDMLKGKFVITADIAGLTRRDSEHAQGRNRAIQQSVDRRRFCSYAKV